MLHRSLLPGHERWRSFLSQLRYVVVDECHHYRGVFGAHVAQVLRRLRRICAAYGAQPTFVLASATVAEPEAAAGPAHRPRRARRDRRLLASRRGVAGDVAAGAHPVHRRERRPARAAPRPPRPPTCSPTSSPRTSGPWPSSGRAAAPSRSRSPPPSCWRRSIRRCPAKVAAYRGGYLPEERRELERQLRAGELTGLAATNALELGIDVSGLDAVLLAGFPGTRAAFWQQVGRAGRGATTRSAILVARDDPLDTYLVTHPEALLGQPVEATVFDPTNPYVLGPHLCAAAAELPLTEADLPMFGADRPRRRRPADPRRAAAAPLARLVLDRPEAGQRPRRHPFGRRPAGGAGRGRHRPRDRHRRLRQRALDRARRRGLRPSRRDLAGRVARPRRARRRDRPRRPGLLHDRSRDHRHLDRRASRTTAAGATAGCPWVRSTSPTRSCRT